MQQLFSELFGLGARDSENTNLPGHFCAHLRSFHQTPRPKEQQHCVELCVEDDIEDDAAPSIEGKFVENYRQSRRDFRRSYPRTVFMAGRHGAGCSQRRSAWLEAGRCISLRLAAPRCAPTRRAAARCDTARQDANRCGPLRPGAARHDAKCAGRTPLHVYSLRLTLALLFDFAYSTSSQADMAQLVEHNLAKVGVAGSSPVVRSIVCTEPISIGSFHFWRSGQVVRQRPAKPLPPVRIRASPPAQRIGRPAGRPFPYVFKLRN